MSVWGSLEVIEPTWRNLEVGTWVTHRLDKMNQFLRRLCNSTSWSKSSFRFKNKETGKKHGSELGQGDNIFFLKTKHSPPPPPADAGEGNLWSEEYKNQSIKDFPPPHLRWPYPGPLFPLPPLLQKQFPPPPSLTSSKSISCSTTIKSVSLTSPGASIDLLEPGTHFSGDFPVRRSPKFDQRRCKWPTRLKIRRKSRRRRFLLLLMKVTLSPFFGHAGHLTSNFRDTFSDRNRPIPEKIRVHESQY